MMKETLISIIVPVYKAENFLRQCLDSILNQTYSFFELILIDDGSPDASGSICDEYAAMDSRIKVIHQPNAGPSCCRNKGIEVSKGEYLCFIDSDDWVDLDFLFSMVNATKGQDRVDLVVSGFILDGKKQKILKDKDKRFTMKDKDDFHRLVVNRLLFGPCQKLYLSSIVKQNQLSFPLGIRYGEDRLFNYAFLHHVNCIASVDKAAYHYRIHESGSLSSSPYSNMFELEYEQWKALYHLYKERDLLTEESLRYHWRDFYWLVSDNLLSVQQLEYRSSQNEKLSYIRSILCTPEIAQLNQYKHFFEDVSSMQYLAVTKGIALYFYIMYLLNKK